MNYIPILSTAVTLIFTYAVFRRYQDRRGVYLLLWGIGLLFYGLGTLAEAIMAFTFNPLIMKLWYLTGAMLTAAWLGQGTVHLLVRQGRLAASLTGFLTLVSVASLVLIVTAPITSAAGAYDVNAPASSQYQDILVRNGPIVGLTIFLNIYGTITLVGGALYSAYLFWRKKVLVHRLYGNLLIAAGAMAPALGGTFIRIGLADWLYLSELVGAVLMYAGFIQATTVPQPDLTRPDAPSLSTT